MIQNTQTVKAADRIDPQIKEAVLAAIGKTNEEYSLAIYTGGCAYLETYFKEYPQVVDELLQKRAYWSWWCWHFQMREQEFLEMMQELEHPECYIDNLVETWHRLHDAAYLQDTLYLHGQILYNSYPKMFEEVTKEKNTYATA